MQPAVILYIPTDRATRPSLSSRNGSSSMTVPSTEEFGVRREEGSYLSHSIRLSEGTPLGSARSRRSPAANAASRIGPSWRSAEDRRKCDSATGSLTTIASGRGPSHPRSTIRGSRLPAMSRRELQVDAGHYTPPKGYARTSKEKARRRQRGLSFSKNFQPSRRSTAGNTDPNSCAPGNMASPDNSPGAGGYA